MSAPCRHTCPDIDKLIEKAVNPLRWLSEALKFEDIEMLHSIIRDCISDIKDIEGLAEDLRGSNHALRIWGYDLEEEIKEKDSLIDDLETQISDLQSNAITP